MAKKATKLTKLRKATPEDVADAVGLFMIAFGEGVDQLHVHRDTVRAIRDYFTKSVGTAFLDESWDADWKKDAATVLGWTAAVGRLASHSAMTQKRTVINRADFEEALCEVKAEHHEGNNPPPSGRGAKPLGKYCT